MNSLALIFIRVYGVLVFHCSKFINYTEDLFSRHIYLLKGIKQHSQGVSNWTLTLKWLQGTNDLLFFIIMI